MMHNKSCPQCGKAFKTSKSEQRLCSRGCAAAANRTHGMAKPRRPEYTAWYHMMARCLKEHHPNFQDYGGRGISVCKRWQDSFEHFLADMGPRPSDRHTLERLDNNGSYNPKNCVWATQKEQCRNTRRSKHITFRGRTQTIKEWSDETGINHETIRNRIFNAGWPVAEALTRLPQGARQ